MFPRHPSLVLPMSLLIQRLTRLARSRRPLAARRPSILWFLAAAMAAGPALASDLPSYSADTLDLLWRNQVSGQPLPNLTPVRIETTLHGQPFTVSTTPPASGTTSILAGIGSHGGTLPPEDPAESVTVYLPICELGASLQAELASRQVALASFLTKSDRRQPEKALSEKTNILTLRQYSARLELFLIAAVRILAADTIPDKCAQYKEAGQLLGLVNAQEPEVKTLLERSGYPLSLEPRFTELQRIFTNLSDESKQAITAAPACVVAPVSNRGATLRAAVGQLEASLALFLDPNAGALKETLNAIGESKAALSAQQERVAAAKPYTSDLLDLELKASNAVSNFGLVRSDSLGVQRKIAEMRSTVNVDAIANLGGKNDDALRTHDKLGQLDSELASLRDSLKTYLLLLKHLPENPAAKATTPNPLARCSAAAGEEDPAATIDLAALNDCLSALTVLVDAAAKRTEFQLQMTEVAEKLKHLSPEIVRDRSGL